MKKVLLSIIMIFASIFLFSCIQNEPEGELTSLEDHLNTYRDIYNERIHVFNHIANEEIKSVVKVLKNATTFISSQTGSGVIFKQTGTTYYVLTNNHVIDDPFINRANYQLIDYKGDSYEATLIARDPDYDLAVLSFSYTGDELKVGVLAHTNLAIDQFVAVIGYPEAHINAMTFGFSIDYDKITIDDIEDRTFIFDSLITDVPVKSGSSGSPVFDAEGSIVGLVYAASIKSTTDTSRFMYAVPAESIIEFLIKAQLMEASS